MTTTRWQALRFRGGRVDGLPGGWLMGWRGQGQWASTALIAGEQFGLGGTGQFAREPVSVCCPADSESARRWVHRPRMAQRHPASGVCRCGLAAWPPVKQRFRCQRGLGLRYMHAVRWHWRWIAGIVKGSRVSLAQNPSTNAPSAAKLHLNLSAVLDAPERPLQLVFAGFLCAQSWALNQIAVWHRAHLIHRESWCQAKADVGGAGEHQLVVAGAVEVHLQFGYRVEESCRHPR